MRLSKKVFACLAGAAVLVAILVQVYYLFHYTLYRRYKDLTTPAAAAQSREFKPLSETGSGVPGMVLASQTDELSLYANLETAEIAVLDRRNGAVAYSNPPEADSDPLANKANKAMLKSQLVLEYFDANRRPGTFNSYDYAVSRGQVSASSVDGGIRFTYVLGDLESPTGIVPVYITQERLDGFMEALAEVDGTGNGVTYITTRYRESADAPGFLELVGGSKPGASTLRRLRENFTLAGYTKEDFEADMLASGVDGAIPVSFTVCVDYSLEGSSLVVKVPTGLMDETGGAAISGLQLLRSFGAAGPDEEGYALVPNGSGALINFNNGKTGAEDYMQAVYGIDPMYMDYLVLENTEKARLPIFGLSREEGSSIFAIIERGDSLATITATVSGKLSSYTCVYPYFMLRANMALSMFGITGNEAEMPVMEKDLYKADLAVRYCFLEEPGYSAMAGLYRDYLIKKGVLGEKLSEGDLPLYIDIIGGVEATRFFLGIKHQSVLPMTTFGEAMEIHKSLLDAGAEKQVLNLQGWFNGGWHHDAMNKVKLVKKLGSKGDLEDLAEQVESSGGRLYLDADFQRIPNSASGVNRNRAGARYYGGGYIGTFGMVNPVSLMNVSSVGGYEERIYTLLSPKFLPRQMDDFTKRIGGFPSSGVSARDLADILYSDKKRTEYISREEAKDIVSASLAQLKEAAGHVMVSGGNAYSLKFASDIINAPVEASDFYMIDEEVPFYEMVVHGYINYSGKPLNLNGGGLSDSALKLIETGASPHFAFTAKDSSELKYTGLNHYYSVTFSNWEADAASIYKTVSSALSPVEGHVVEKHEIIAPGVRRVTYGNGHSIVVNYSEEEFMGVSAKGFAVEVVGQ
jgi:hypothetical protein